MGIKLARQKLFSSVDANNLEDVKLVLSKYPELVNEAFDYKEISYPILRAVWKGKEEMVRLLIELGADFNLKNKIGTNCLMLAAAKGYLDIVNYLLTLDIDINQSDNKNCSALDHAVLKGFYNTADVLYKNVKLQGIGI